MPTTDELIARLPKEAAMLREIAKSEARGIDWQANLTGAAEWFDRASAQLAEARQAERAAVVDAPSPSNVARGEATTSDGDPRRQSAATGSGLH